jgi:hypothetical protein
MGQAFGSRFFVILIPEKFYREQKELQQCLNPSREKN